MADEQYLYLTTTGWKSGNPHEIEIWYVAYKDRYYLVSQKRQRAHWVQNLMRNPAVTIRVGERITPGKARPIEPSTDPELVTTIKRLMDDKYRWSHGLIVELESDGTIS